MLLLSIRFSYGWIIHDHKLIPNADHIVSIHSCQGCKNKVQPQELTACSLAELLRYFCRLTALGAAWLVGKSDDDSLVPDIFGGIVTGDTQSQSSCGETEQCVCDVHMSRCSLGRGRDAVKHGTSASRRRSHASVGSCVGK